VSKKKRKRKRRRREPKRRRRKRKRRIKSKRMRERPTLWSKFQTLTQTKFRMFQSQDFCRESTRRPGPKAGLTLGHARTANGQNPVSTGGQEAGRETGTERFAGKR
jgi:hypothetical protein